LVGHIGSSNVFFLAFSSSYLQPHRTVFRLRDKHERQLRRVLLLEHEIIGYAPDKQFRAAEFEGIPALDLLNLRHILDKTRYQHLPP